MKKIFLSIAVLLAIVSSSLGRPGSVNAAVGNDIFNPNVNDVVYTTALQSDGKILVGGGFSQISGTSRSSIGRLNPDGSLDTTFNPGANNAVRIIVGQPDDKILVGGDFTNIAGATKYRFARLTSEGALDTAFANISVDETVHAIALQDDGKIILGGNFTQILIGSTLYNREKIARLNANGTMDTSFNPGADQTVRALAVQKDGKILVGGVFTTLASAASSHIGRLNANGSLDDSFSAGTDNTINAIAVHPDGRIVIGGNFAKVNQITCSGIARLYPDGKLDPSINHTFNRSAVYSLVIQSNGKILFGGFFSTIDGQASTMIARLNFGGGLDPGFSIALGDSSQWVNTLTVQPDGKILAGGTFTQCEGFVTNRLVRLYPDGSKESPMAPALDYKVSAIALHPNGSTLIGGDFTTVDGTSHQGIALIRQNGLPDHDFTASVDDPGFVSAIAIQADGKILVGGEFNYMNGAIKHNIGRLNKDGSIDPSFYSDINGPVYAIALQKDGKILIGGNFTTIGSNVRSYVARLNTDGSLDTSFESDVPDVVRTIAVQDNGQILIGGDFTYVYSSARYYLARLNAAGTLDASFTADSGDIVRSIVVQPDGKILASGDFTSLNGQSVNRIGRLNPDGTLDTSFTTGPNAGANGAVYSMALQANGKILVGGAFTALNNSAVKRIGRLHTGGGLDPSFLPGDTNDYVLALVVQPDGKVIAGGRFTLLNDKPCTYLGRIATDDTAFQKLSVDLEGTEILWTLHGFGPQFHRVSFEYSTDGVNYTHIGDATFIGTDKWSLSGNNLFQALGNVFIRARGFASSGAGNGSVSITESVLNAYFPEFRIHLPLIVH